mgnify:CR=1 FL=1
MKNRINNEIEKWKKDIKENATMNGTSYKDELKTALDNNDIATLEAKMNELEQMAQQMAAYQYQQNQNTNTTQSANDDVVDADFTEKN